MSLMRVSPAGCVDRNCGGAPLLAGHHLLPQRDAGRRVVAGAGGQVHAHEVGLGLVARG